MAEDPQVDVEIPCVALDQVQQRRRSFPAAGGGVFLPQRARDPADAEAALERQFHRFPDGLQLRDCPAYLMGVSLDGYDREAGAVPLPGTDTVGAKPDGVR